MPAKVEGRSRLWRWLGTSNSAQVSVLVVGTTESRRRMSSCYTGNVLPRSCIQNQDGACRAQLASGMSCRLGDVCRLMAQGPVPGYGIGCHSARSQRHRASRLLDMLCSNCSMCRSRSSSSSPLTGSRASPRSTALHTRLGLPQALLQAEWLFTSSVCLHTRNWWPSHVMKLGS